MPDTRQKLEAILRERIAVLDGSWGVLIQRELRGEDAYRGERFRDHSHDVAGDPDLLNITRPEVVTRIHNDYFEAGADIATTNTFTATTIGQADYAFDADVVHEMNVEGARLARRAADDWSARTPDKPRFVAGAVGPLNVTLSLSPKVEDPAYRAVSFERSPRRVRAPDSRAARRRRRPAARRDRVRLAQREGGDRRRARRGARAAALAVLHGDRQERPQSLRADGRGVLALGPACEPADRRRQLLARRRRDAALRRGHGGHRDDVGRLLSERRAAERVRPARRAAARHEPPARRVRGRWSRQRRRRLLRHDSRPRSRHRGRGRGRASARVPGSRSA